MPGQFEPLPGGGAAVALDDVEISIIRSLAVQMTELIGPGPAEDASGDPLAELFAEGPSEPPSDPVLRRLFPELTRVVSGYVIGVTVIGRGELGTSTISARADTICRSIVSTPSRGSGKAVNM